MVGTLLLQIGEVGQRLKIQRSTSVLGAGGDNDNDLVIFLAGSNEVLSDQSLIAMKNIAKFRRR